MLENPADLLFDDESHTYRLQPANAMLPSVTQIMRFMSREVYDRIPYGTLDTAADRGTRAHEQTANLDMYGMLETDEDTQPYLMAYQQFLTDYNPTWTAVEWRNYHRGLMYAGTIDRLGYVLPDDGTGMDIVDIKTTRSLHCVMLSTQLGGYSEVVRSNGIKIRRRYGLQLLPDGKYRFQEVPDGFRTFLYCLGLHNELAKEKRA